MTRRHFDSSDMADRVDDGLLAKAVGSMHPLARRLVIAHVCFGLSYQQAATLVGVSRQYAATLIQCNLWAFPINHPELGGLLDGTIQPAPSFRRLLAETFDDFTEDLVLCGHCASVYMPMAYRPLGGRPRRFCSAACKQAAYRARKKAKTEPMA